MIGLSILSSVMVSPMLKVYMEQILKTDTKWICFRSNEKAT